MSATLKNILLVSNCGGKTAKKRPIADWVGLRGRCLGYKMNVGTYECLGLNLIFWKSFDLCIGFLYSAIAGRRPRRPTQSAIGLFFFSLCPHNLIQTKNEIRYSNICSELQCARLLLAVFPTDPACQSAIGLFFFSLCHHNLIQTNYGFLSNIKFESFF